MDYFVHSTAIVDEGAEINSGTKIWHFSHVMATAKIGHHCTLGQNVFVGNRVVIGDGVRVQNNVSIFEGVVVKDNAFIGPSVVFTNVKNPRSFIARKNEFRETTVDTGASVGANSTIICGNNIGKFALVGAGAVVTKNVPNYALMVGNPAVQIGWVSENGITLDFDESGYAQCSESKKKYRLFEYSVEEVF